MCDINNLVPKSPARIYVLSLLSVVAVLASSVCLLDAGGFSAGGPSCGISAETVLRYDQNLAGMELSQEDLALWSGLLAEGLALVDIDSRIASPPKIGLRDRNFYRKLWRAVHKETSALPTTCALRWTCELSDFCKDPSGGKMMSPCLGADPLLVCSHALLTSAYLSLDDQDLDESDRLARECSLLRYASLYGLPDSRPSDIHRFLETRFENFLHLAESRAQIAVAGGDAGVAGLRAQLGIGDIDLVLWFDSLSDFMDSALLLALRYPDLQADLRAWLEPILVEAHRISPEVWFQNALRERFDWVLKIDSVGLTGPAHHYFAGRFCDDLRAVADNDQALAQLRMHFPELKSLLSIGTGFLNDKGSAWIAYEKVSDDLYAIYKEANSKGPWDGDANWLLEKSVALLTQGVRSSNGGDALVDLKSNARRNLAMRSTLLVRRLFGQRAYEDLACFADSFFSNPPLEPPELDQLHALMAQIDYALGRTKRATEHLKGANGLITLDRLIEFRKEVGSFVSTITDPTCKEEAW